jgi:hypothetical protein
MRRRAPLQRSNIRRRAPLPHLKRRMREYLLQLRCHRN